MIDERTEEQAALYAVDALEGAEKTAFEEDLSAREDLRKLVDELRAAAASLAHGVPARIPPPELEQRILQAVRAEQRPTLRDPAPARWIPWAVAAGIAVLCGYLAADRATKARQLSAAREQVTVLTAARDRTSNVAAEKERALEAAEAERQKLREERETLVQEVARWREREKAMRVQNTTLAEERADLEKKVAELEKQGLLSQLRVATLSSKLPTAPRATATIVWDDEKQQGILKVANAPVTAANQDYQLWVVDPEYQQPVDAGVFNVDEKGGSEFTFRPKLRISSAKAFAVSLERKGGVPKAEGPMVLVSN